MKNSIIKDALILFAITVVAGLLLGLTYTVTKEPIEKPISQGKNCAENLPMPSTK